jgi:hypothetical protein
MNIDISSIPYRLPVFANGPQQELIELAALPLLTCNADCHDCDVFFAATNWPDAFWRLSLRHMNRKETT